MIGTHKPKRSIEERRIEAEQCSSHWLAEGNEALERGDRVKAEECFSKSQFWLDKYNRLARNS